MQPEHSIGENGRRRWQVSLRLMLVGMGVVAGFFGWLRHEWAKIEVKGRAMALVEAGEGRVVVGDEGDWWQELLGDPRPGEFGVELWGDDVATQLAELNCLNPRMALGVEVRLRGDGLSARDWEVLRSCRQDLTLKLDCVANLPELVRCRNVRVLDLGWSDVTDEQLDAIGQLKQLRGLRLTRTAISDRGVARLARLTKLKYLELGGCSQITSQGLAELAQLPELEFLLIGPEVTPEQIKQLSRLPKLKAIGFYECEELSPEELAPFFERRKDFGVVYVDPLPPR